MNHRNRSYGTRAVIGALLIIIGGILLLKSMGFFYFSVGNIIFSGGFLMVVIGILILINSQKKIPGLIIILIGLFWLSKRIFYIDIDGGIIAAAAIIALGFYIILRQRHRIEIPQTPNDQINSGNENFHSFSGRTISRDFIDEVCIFGGGYKHVNSENFKGGNVTAIFGGGEIDLTTCKLAEGNSVINVLAMFGGIEIHVPRDWNVLVSITPVFGGFSNKIVRDPNKPIDTSRTLYVKGLAMFGGIEINSKEKGYVF